jgi:hypothetical protein
LKLILRVDEVEAVTFIGDPIVFNLCAAIEKPRIVCGKNIVYDFCNERTITGWEDFRCDDLIIEDIAADDEAVHDFDEDRFVNFPCQRVDLAFVERAEE